MQVTLAIRPSSHTPARENLKIHARKMQGGFSKIYLEFLLVHPQLLGSNQWSDGLASSQRRNENTWSYTKKTTLLTY